MFRLLSAVVALTVASAGCLGFGGSPPPEEEVVGPNVKPPPTQSTPKAPRDPNLRWHYHNYWGTSAKIVLLNGNLTLPIVNPDRLTLTPKTATVDFSLPFGRIVPPETGELNVTILFTPTGSLPFTGLNFSYRPGGAVNYTGVNVEPGVPISIPVSYDQTDVPHRGSTAWKFRLGPDSAAGPAFANGTAQVIIEARIGRPLLIDPPHFDQWRGRTSIPLAIVTANATALKAADDRYANVDFDRRSSELRRDVLEIPLPNGSLVPDRTREVVVHLFWNSTVLSVAKPGLAYAEDNSPSNGTLTPTTDGETSREYRIPIGIGMADSPYANQSTWRFAIVVEGPPGSAFTGSISLHATAERRP